MRPVARDPHGALVADRSDAERAGPGEIQDDAEGNAALQRLDRQRQRRMIDAVLN
jgi:hypothetical protein